MVILETESHAAWHWPCPASEAGAGHGEKTYLCPLNRVFIRTANSPLFPAAIEKSVLPNVSRRSQEERGGRDSVVSESWVYFPFLQLTAVSSHLLLSQTPTSISVSSGPFTFLVA